MRGESLWFLRHAEYCPRIAHEDCSRPIVQNDLAARKGLIPQNDLAKRSGVWRKSQAFARLPRDWGEGNCDCGLLERMMRLKRMSRSKGIACGFGGFAYDQRTPSMRVRMVNFVHRIVENLMDLVNFRLGRC